MNTYQKQKQRIKELEADIYSLVDGRGEGISRMQEVELKWRVKFQMEDVVMSGSRIPCHHFTETAKWEEQIVEDIKKYEPNMYNVLSTLITPMKYPCNDKPETEYDLP
jgi:hypothetical protein